MLTLLELLDRAETGPIMDQREWDLKFLPKLIRSKAQEHEIHFTPETLIPSTDDMANSIFQAGYEVAIEAGLYCISTERRIIFSEDEIKAMLREVPQEYTAGKGQDERRIRKRKPGDTSFLTASGGPIGTTISEELFIPVVQSYIQEPLIDFYNGGTLAVIQGRQIRTGTPTEIMGAISDLMMIREAARRAGRPGIANLGVETSPSPLGHLTAAHPEFGWQDNDVHLIPLISEFKTDYNQLNKVALATAQHGVINAYTHPIIGGYIGGPEACAVAIVAGDILSFIGHQSTAVGHFGHDHRYGGNTSPEGIWTETMGHLALNLNVNTIHSGGSSPVSGPVTKMLMQEITATAIAATVRGDAKIGGVRSAAGVKAHHCSGLEARFMVEVSRAVIRSKLSRASANDIVIEYIKKYKDQLKNPPLGKPFEECYDVQKVTPTEEWLSVYHEGQKDLQEYGLDCTGF